MRQATLIEATANDDGAGYDPAVTDAQQASACDCDDSACDSCHPRPDVPLRTVLRTHEQALAWIQRWAPWALEYQEKDTPQILNFSAACTRCGGSGRGPWFQDGGICYGCGGADTSKRRRLYMAKCPRCGLGLSQTTLANLKIKTAQLTDAMPVFRSRW